MLLPDACQVVCDGAHGQAPDKGEVGGEEDEGVRAGGQTGESEGPAELEEDAALALPVLERTPGGGEQLE